MTARTITTEMVVMGNRTSFSRGNRSRDLGNFYVVEI